MNISLARSNTSTRIGFRFVVIVLLALGIFLRVINLDQKVYWFDESFTSLRISGYTEQEVIQEVFSGQVLTANDLLKYQQTNASKTLEDTIQGLAVEEPQLTPLYFILVRYWTQWFGHSIATVRSLSVLLSLLVFPALYWLSLELFRSKLVGLTAIALIAVSPLHLLLAQEARPYSLWILTSIVSSAALLRAIRRQTRLDWIAYAVTLIVGLYSFLFFGLGIISHGIYLLLTEKLRWSKTSVNYLLASSVGLIAFLPWILTILTNPNPMVSLGSRQVDFTLLVKAWILNLSLVLFDFDRGWCFPIGSSYCRFPLGLSDILIYLALPVLILQGYSIYFLCQNTPKRVWCFVLTLAGTIAVALVASDLVFGGHRSSITRYLVPVFLGIQLSIAYLLANRAVSAQSTPQAQKIWKFIAALVFSVGILSCITIANAEAWWSKGQNYHVAPIARVLNTFEEPFLIYPVSPDVGIVGRIMPLMHQLDQRTKIQFVDKSTEAIEIPDNFNPIFIYSPSKAWLNQMQEDNKYRVEPVYFDPIHLRPRLYQIKQNSSERYSYSHTG